MQAETAEKKTSLGEETSCKAFLIAK